MRVANVTLDELLLRVVVRINKMLISCAVAQYLGVKESPSLQWTVAFFMVQSANRVTANKFYAIAKISDREADVKANRFFFAADPLMADSKGRIPQLNPKQDDSGILTMPPQASTTSTYRMSR